MKREACNVAGIVLPNYVSRITDWGWLLIQRKRYWVKKLLPRTKNRISPCSTKAVEAGKPMVFVTTLLLLGLIVAMNSGAIYIRNRLKRKYAGGQF